MITILTIEDFKNEVYSNNDGIREQFKELFNDKIEIFVTELYKAYLEFQKIDDEINTDQQKACTAMYLFNSINNLLVSMNLLISGYLMVSGSLIRCFLESSLMAIIISRNDLDKNYYKLYMEKGTGFKVYKVFDIFEKNISKYDTNEKAWELLKDIKGNYNLYCHSSAFAVSELFHFGESSVCLGASFDIVKKSAYEKEMNMRISSIDFLKNTIDIVKLHFVDL